MRRVIVDEKRVAIAEEQDSAVSTTTLRPCRDRREMASREALIQRVAGEFREIPGLCLTVEQAGRLFGLSADVCERVLRSLSDDGRVQRAGRYYSVFRGDSIGSAFLTHRHHD